MGHTTTNKDESPLTRVRREFTGRHWVAVTLMGVPRGILNSLNLAALALIYVVCAETLTVVRESPWDLNYFIPYQCSGRTRAAVHYETQETNGASRW